MIRMMTVAAICLSAVSAPAHGRAGICGQIEAYLQPYVVSHNFSGAVLVDQGGKTICTVAQGIAGPRPRDRVRLNTRFHIASMSMQFTAAAILRLVDSGDLTLDTPLDRILTGF